MPAEGWIDHTIANRLLRLERRRWSHRMKLFKLGRMRGWGAWRRPIAPSISKPKFSAAPTFCRN
jgi:hypothetical protein